MVIEFGKKAVLDKAESNISTSADQTAKGSYFRIVRAGTSKKIASINYNTDTEKRKNAYQEINRILAEG